MSEELSVINHRSNNFDCLRLIAASMVVISHSFDLLGTPDMVGKNSEPLVLLTGNQIIFGSLGVWIFFSASGYLITQSLLRSSGYKVYFVKRFLRIFPALILDLFISAFLWGPLVTALTLKEYFTDPETYRYLQNIFLYKLHLTLPGVFTSNPYPNIVNGSLWTLPYEFLCYIGIVVLLLVGILRNRYIYGLFFFLSLAGGIFILQTRFFQITLPFTSFVFNVGFPLVVYFGAGALILLFQDKIKFRFSIAVVVFAVWCLSMYFGLAKYFSYFCIPYLALCFAFEKRIPFQNAGKFGDFSYGIYIYSFSVQQTIVYCFGNIPVAEMIVLSFLGTVPLAVFSWFAVEKKALKLKEIIMKRQPATLK